MIPRTFESLCSVNPETLGANTAPDLEFRYLDISSVTEGKIDWKATQVVRFFESPSRARRVVRRGDVLLCTVRPGLQSHAIIHDEQAPPVVCSTGFAVLRPKEDTDSSYIFHSLFGEPVAAQLRGLETGSNYPAVSENDVRRLRVPTSSPPEMRRIGAVLDSVDEAVARTEAVIAKLKQVRAGLLHDFLTCGLDENGQLRDPITHPEQFQDSPLGRIPREWEIKSIRQLTEYISYGFTNPMPTTTDGPWMLTAFDIGDGEIKYEQARHTSQSAFDSMLTAKSKPRIGDVLITKDGTLGRVAAVDREGVCINQSVAVLRPLPAADTDFVVEFLRSSAGQTAILAEVGGSTIKHIYITKLADVQLPYPSTGERTRLVETLAGLEAELEAESKQVTKLRLLRSGLMTDVLTGRVRVPEGAI